MQNDPRRGLVHAFDLDRFRIRRVDGDGSALYAYVIRECVINEEHGALVLADKNWGIIFDLGGQFALLFFERRQIVCEVAPAILA